MRRAYMFELAKKTLAFTVYNMKNEIFDTASVLLSANTAKKLCERKNDDTGISQLFLCLIQRSEVLYCSIYNAKEKEPYAGAECREYFRRCCGIAQRALLLFDRFSQCGKDSTRLLYKDLLCADIEDCLLASRDLRFFLTQSYGKIFLALPELEFVSGCTDILKKSERFADMAFSIYNKFTVYT